MARTVQVSLPPMSLQKVSSSEATSESPRNLATWQALPAVAMGRAGLSQKHVALSMGRSESWLSRALRGLEKLGWNDLAALEDPLFWRELLALMAEFHDIAAGSEREKRDAAIGKAVREAMELLR